MKKSPPPPPPSTTTTTTTDTSVSPELLLFPPNKQLAPPVRITRNTTSYNSPDSCQYLDNIIPSTSFNYDCINMSFLEPSPIGNFIPTIRSNNTITNMYLDIDNDDYDDYDYKYDYKPLINQDLLMIDQLILKVQYNIGFFNRKCFIYRPYKINITITTGDIRFLITAYVYLFKIYYVIT